MRTTLDIPKEIIEEAQELLHFKSKTDAVIYSLTEMIRRKKMEQLKDLVGKVEIRLDVPKSRGRPSTRGRRRK